MTSKSTSICGSLALLLASSTVAADASFFITSAGPGNGADLGGLAGADRHCQKLAEAPGAGNRTWRAYLSTTATSEAPAVDARDRIGSGPWRNVEGVLVATNVDELHADRITRVMWWWTLAAASTPAC